MYYNKNMENIRYLKYKQENNILILQLNTDEYKEIQMHYNYYIKKK